MNFDYDPRMDTSPRVATDDPRPFIQEAIQSRLENINRLTNLVGKIQKAKENSSLKNELTSLIDKTQQEIRELEAKNSSDQALVKSSRPKAKLGLVRKP